MPSAPGHHRDLDAYLYRPLVMGTSGALAYLSWTVVWNSIHGEASIVKIIHPFEMYVEFPILFIWSLIVFIWSFIKQVKGGGTCG